jgi:hypothetical protein
LELEGISMAHPYYVNFGDKMSKAEFKKRMEAVARKKFENLRSNQ